MRGKCLLIISTCLLAVTTGVKTQGGKKLATKQLQHAEFISLGSMDQVSQTSALLENTRVSHLNVSLEKLADKQIRIHPSPLIEHIQRIQIQAPYSLSTTVDYNMYKKAVQTLKQMAPELQTVTLTGEYMFKPTSEKRLDVIKEEITFVRTFLKEVINAFESQNVTVDHVRFIVGFIVSDKTQKQVDFARLIRSTFGYQPTPEEIESKTVGMVVKMNETTCYIGIGMNPSKQEDGWLTPTSIIAVGRSRFQEQVILTNFKKEWFTKVLDLLNTEPSPMYAKHRVNDLSRRRLLVNSTALDDPKIRAVGRISDIPRRLFLSQSDMDFMQFQQPPRIQLEDFYDHHTDTIQVEKEVQQLGLKVTIQNRTDRIYQRAVENLKKLVPNLCEVSLYGGYVFQPRKLGKDTVQKEIEYYAENVRQWIEAFDEIGINVTEIRFIATFVLPNKVREASQYEEALQRSFHYTPTKIEIEQNAVRMRLKFNDVLCRLALHFRDIERDQTFCPTPPTTERYPEFNYFCSEKRPFQQWYRSVWADQRFSW